jgi:hypothetical protein
LGSIEHGRHEKYEMRFLSFFVFRVQENEVIGFIPVILEKLAITLPPIDGFGGKCFN